MQYCKFAAINGHITITTGKTAVLAAIQAGAATTPAPAAGITRKAPHAAAPYYPGISDTESNTSRPGRAIP